MLAAALGDFGAGLDFLEDPDNLFTLNFDFVMQSSWGAELHFQLDRINEDASVQHSAASAHADAGEVLDWLRAAPRAARMVFVTHGEPDAGDALRLRIERALGWHAHVPDYLEHVDPMP